MSDPDEREEWVVKESARMWAEAQDPLDEREEWVVKESARMWAASTRPAWESHNPQCEWPHCQGGCWEAYCRDSNLESLF